MADVLQQGWEKYLNTLQRYPLRTKAITAGVLAGCSDCFAQKLAGAKSLQYKRLFSIVLYGLLYAGPFGHYFHKLIDHIFAAKKDSTTLVKKVVLEQITVNPWNNFFTCATWRWLLKFWPIVAFLNYRYIPQNLRVLFANVAAVCWANYLKWRVLYGSRSAPALKKAL